MNRPILSLVAAIAALGTAGTASAQSRPAPAPMPQQASGFYVGAGLGYGSARFKNGDFNFAGQLGPTFSQSNSLDENYWAPWKAFGGYRFNRFLAAEAAYLSAGKYGYDSTIFNAAGAAVGTVANDYRVNSFNLAGVARYPFQGTGFAVQGKLGAAISEVKNSRSVSGVAITGGGESNTQTNLLWGLGASYDFTSRVGVLFEYENIGRVGNERTGRAEVDTFTGSVYFKF